MKNREESNIYYVYCLLEKDSLYNKEHLGITFNNTPVYIGLGKRNRCNISLNMKETQLNKKLYYIMLNTNMFPDDAIKLEKDFIENIGIQLEDGILINRHAGEGGHHPNGYKHTEEHKSNIAKGVRRSINEGTFNNAIRMKDGTHNFLTRHPSKDPKIRKQMTEKRNKSISKKKEPMYKLMSDWLLSKSIGYQLTMHDAKYFGYISRYILEHRLTDAINYFNLEIEIIKEGLKGSTNKTYTITQKR